MSYVQELKELASEHGLEFKKNANAKSMERLLRESGVEFEVVEEEAPKAEDTSRLAASELSDLMAKYDYVSRNTRAPDYKMNMELLKRQRRKVRDLVEGHEKLLRRLWEWERSHRLISTADEYALNAIEYKEVQDECQCKEQMVPGRRVNLGDVCKYRKYFDESRECDVYVVYTTRVIPPEHQITPSLAKKMELGFRPESMDDFPPEKVVYHRFTLRASEFFKHFELLD